MSVFLIFLMIVYFSFSVLVGWSFVEYMLGQFKHGLWYPPNLIWSDRVTFKYNLTNAGKWVLRIGSMILCIGALVLYYLGIFITVYLYSWLFRLFMRMFQKRDKKVKDSKEDMDKK